MADEESGVSKADGRDNGLVVIAADGKAYFITEGDIRRWEIPPDSEQYKRLQKQYIENNAILAFAADVTMETCICVVLNLKALESQSKNKHK